MNSEHFEVLRTDASAEVFAQKVKSARNAVDKRLAEMVETGEANILTDEEERLLRSFRRFKATCKPGAVFKWQTRPVEGVTIHEDTSLIRDPQEVA
jgi:histidinol dehydrogenase